MENKQIVTYLICTYLGFGLGWYIGSYHFNRLVKSMDKYYGKKNNP